MSTMTLKARAGVAGKYRLRTGRRDADGNESTTYDSGWFDNIITDAGLDLMGGNGFLDSCQVGSGSTAPAESDTSLVSYVAGTSTIDNTTIATQSTSPFYGSFTITYKFDEGDAAGNLSEVGIGTAATGGTLFSRALIVDGGGSPTTITVLADEFLEVTYQLQLVPPTTDSSFNVTDSGPAGTVHAVVLRASNVTSTNVSNGSWSPPIATGSTLGAIELTSAAARAYNGAIGTIEEPPSGNVDDATSATADAYASDSLEATGTILFELDDGNLSGGISALRFQFVGGGCWQTSFDPAIPKTNLDTLNFSVKVSWTRTTAL